VITQASCEDAVSDVLFEADDPDEWRRLLSEPVLDTKESFLPTVLLAQMMVNMHKLRELELAPEPLPAFYDRMHTFSLRYGLSNTLSALWHFTCVVRLAPMDLIAEAAGRGGNPDSESVVEVQTWVGTPAARLAALHAGNILFCAADLQDLGFLVPRCVHFLFSADLSAIFQATLLLFCYLSLSPPAHLPPIDVRVTCWQQLAPLCDTLAPLDDIQRFVAFGGSPLSVPGFFDGREPTLDIVR
jgi:hypothetical protein